MDLLQPHSARLHSCHLISWPSQCLTLISFLMKHLGSLEKFCTEFGFNQMRPTKLNTLWRTQWTFWALWKIMLDLDVNWTKSTRQEFLEEMTRWRTGDWWVMNYSLGYKIINWNADFQVNYWETAMIFEVDYDDIAHNLKLSGLAIMSHELAHFFFGNAVTCEWWDYIWWDQKRPEMSRIFKIYLNLRLNEGFATVFEFHLTGILYQHWNLRHFFALRKLHNAMRNDASETTRAMTSPLVTPQEISAGFNYVVYDKAGSVLRMFQNAVGELVFSSALKLYLETKLV